MTEYLWVVNWDKWQTYRRDRDLPPWIKVHRRLLRNVEWCALTDAERGQLVCIWMIAADKNGCIPNDPELIQRLAITESKPDLSHFIDLGFLTPKRRRVDAKLTPERRQHDALEAEAEAEAEGRKRKGASKADAPRPSLELVATAPGKKSEDEAVQMWNLSTAKTGLPKVQRLTDARRKKLRQRLKECGGIKGWDNAMRLVEGSDFLLGKNGRGWQADFDFLLQEKSFTRLMEGAYANRTNGTGPAGRGGDVLSAARKAEAFFEDGME